VQMAIRLFLALALVAALQAGAVAQNKPVQGKQQVAVKTIWDFQTELGLTERQKSEIKASVSQLNTKIKGQRQRLAAASNRVNQLIKDNASIEVIRGKLHEVANLQIELKIADIETARKINTILTPQQLAKWRDIQKKSRPG